MRVLSIGNFPNNSVSQNANGTIDIIKKKTSVPAIVVYFFRASKSYFSLQYRHALLILLIVIVLPPYADFNRNLTKKNDELFVVFYAF